MKQISLFVCEICGTQFKDKIAAKDCEASHKVPEKIAGCRYLSKNQDAKGYPQTISVAFKDGEVVKYHR